MQSSTGCTPNVGRCLWRIRLSWDRRPSQMKSLFLLLVPLACAQEVLKSSAQSSAFGSISYDDLRSQSTNKADFFVNSLTADGILAIKNVPGLADARRNAFAAVQACLAKSPKGRFLDDNNEPSLTVETLADGTKRQSIGTQVKPGNEHAEISSALLRACPELEEPVETLRETIDKVSSQLMFALDDALLPQTTTVGAPLFHDRAFYSSGGYDYMRTASVDQPFRKYAGTFWKGFSEATQGATQLEHFHSYTPSSSVSTDKTLNYHTDAGLFLLFVPAWYSHDPLDLSPLGGDFKYLDKTGAERTIVTRSASSTAFTSADTDVVSEDSLIMMVGKGAEEYLAPALSERGLKMRAVPHALTVARAADGQTFSRNW